MSDTIERAECPKCGIFFASEAVGKRCGEVYGVGGGCPGVLVAAEYVPKEDRDSAWAEVEHQKALRYRDCVAQIAVDEEKWKVDEANRAALDEIASMKNERDEWDAVEKFRECKAIARHALAAQTREPQA